LSDIRKRYRRSVIGPLWLTISMGISVTFIGGLWSILFNADLAAFIPHFCLGMTIWLFMNNAISEGAMSFTSASHIIRNVKYPYSAFVLWTLWRNVIVFGHLLLVYVVVAILFPPEFGIPMLYLPLGIVLVILNLSWMMFFLSVCSTRFRDIPQILTNLLNILFFLTPVIWVKGQLRDFGYIVDFNPMAHMLDAIRNPLMGLEVQPLTWLILSAMALVGWSITFLIFARFRHRIAYWL